MGMFAGIESARVGSGGVYFLAGLYRVEIVKVFAMRGRKGDDLFIVETKILQSDNAERRPGGSCSWVVNLKHEPSLGNIKGFIAAANGIDPNNKGEVDSQVNEEAVEAACHADNPLEGIIIDLEATEIKTKAGGDFTVHKWTPVEQ